MGISMLISLIMGQARWRRQKNLHFVGRSFVAEKEHAYIHESFIIYTHWIAWDWCSLNC